MPLKLRATGLGTGIDQGLPRVTGEWEIGRMYEARDGPEHLRWFWSMSRSNRVLSVEEAKAQLQTSWDAW
jgi:hypothetical protein